MRKTSKNLKVGDWVIYTYHEKIAVLQLTKKCLEKDFFFFNVIFNNTEIEMDNTSCVDPKANNVKWIVGKPDYLKEISQ